MLTLSFFLSFTGLLDRLFLASLRWLLCFGLYLFLILLFKGLKFTIIVRLFFPRRFWLVRVYRLGVLAHVVFTLC